MARIEREDRAGRHGERVRIGAPGEAEESNK
jgi:hypothetical protein